MCSWRDAAAVLALSLMLSAGAQAQTTYGLGQPATPAEIAAWDIDVRPDGHGVRPGRGTVARGQEIYDAKCATCHGTFGESNQYMVIAGGVRAEDLKAGKAAGLRSPDVVRTLGNKLNHATTLWDYIYRAMPWSAPQSLPVDDVYAVSAYVLFLNEIVPADFELNHENLLTLQMPNRDGLTRQHGMGHVGGKPDVQGSRCMGNCGPEPTITSELPAFALNQHGELRKQFRALGPYAVIDSTRHEDKTKLAGIAPTGARPDADGKAREILVRNACTTCHGFDNAVVGPAFKDVAQRYSQRSEATAYLVEKIRKGSVGAWGQVPMPGQSAIKDDELLAVVRWIMNGAARSP